MWRRKPEAAEHKTDPLPGGGPPIGRLVTFEGGEGTGKSTQAALLQEKLEGNGIAAVLSREPGGSPGAEAIRAVLLGPEGGGMDALTQALLHNAARRDHLRHTIWPALRQRKWVICDRFADSTMAYQAAALGLASETVVHLHTMIAADFVPHLTFILDLPPEVGLERAANRRGSKPADTYEAMDLTFHRRLRSGFQQIAREDPDRVIVIDAGQTVELVAEQCWEAVRARLPVCA